MQMIELRICHQVKRFRFRTSWSSTVSVAEYCTNKRLWKFYSADHKVVSNPKFVGRLQIWWDLYMPDSGMFVNEICCYNTSTIPICTIFVGGVFTNAIPRSCSYIFVAASWKDRMPHSFLSDLFTYIRDTMYLPAERCLNDIFVLCRSYSKYK